MEKYITDPRTGLDYELVGDYYLIAGDDDPAPQPLGLWGRRRLAYLKNQRRSLYNDLLLSGKLEEQQTIDRYMKIKNLYIAIAILGVMGLTACNDMLDVESPSQMDTKMVYGSTEFATNAINGLQSIYLSRRQLR